MKKGEKDILMAIAAFTPLIMTGCFMLFSPYDEILVLSQAMKLILPLAFLILTLKIYWVLYHLCMDGEEKPALFEKLMLVVLYLSILAANVFLIEWVSYTCDNVLMAA